MKTRSILILSNNSMVEFMPYTYHKVITCRPAVVIIKEIVKYKDIKGFHVSKMTVQENRLAFVKLGAKTVFLMPGLAHSHEHYPLEKVKTLFAINAAGGLNKGFKVGDLMIIKDHLNLSRVPSVHPFQGKLDGRVGPRFRTMHGTYDKDLRELAKSVVAEMNFHEDNFHVGVYSMISFPSLETATDFLQSVDVDATGMSHIPEVIVARQGEMKVFGLTLITNKCIMEDGTEDININKAIADGVEKHGDKLQEFVTNMIKKL